MKIKFRTPSRETTKIFGHSYNKYPDILGPGQERRDWQNPTGNLHAFVC
jgi:hypothetical protein